jgi:hypothetical protein
MALLIFQAFGVPQSAVETMLGAIKKIKFFLRTGFCNSTSFTEGGISIKTQGLTQGNRASPAGWVVISICILGAHEKKRGMVQNVTDQLPTYSITSLAILYVYDTDLLHIDLTKEESAYEVHDAIQNSVNSWGNLLMATGGALQPNKCFYSVISYEWESG